MKPFPREEPMSQTHVSTESVGRPQARRRTIPLFGVQACVGIVSHIATGDTTQAFAVVGLASFLFNVSAWTLYYFNR